MEEENNSLQSNKVWKLEQLPNGTKPLKGKWHFAVKYNADGTVNKYKARFVAKGFSQKEGVDYNETYSPTARLTTIRVLLNLAAQYEVCPKQLDIKTAFLNAKIDEDIYLEQPESFEETDLNGGKLYCKLEKKFLWSETIWQKLVFDIEILFRKDWFQGVFVRQMSVCVW